MKTQQIEWLIGLYERNKKLAKDAATVSNLIEVHGKGSYQYDDESKNRINSINIVWGNGSESNVKFEAGLDTEILHKMLEQVKKESDDVSNTIDGLCLKRL